MNSFYHFLEIFVCCDFRRQENRYREIKQVKIKIKIKKTTNVTSYKNVCGICFFLKVYQLKKEKRFAYVEGITQSIS